MKKSITKRMIAAVLSAATMLSSMTIVPIAAAADEDNKASAIEIKVGETYNIWDSGTQKAWFRQNNCAAQCMADVHEGQRRHNDSCILC